MIYSIDTLGQIKTASDVKYSLAENNHFFDRKTMKFFGDKMTSFGVKNWNGKRIMYRKPSAFVNVFGTWKQTGFNYFNAWILEPKHDHINLIIASDEEKKQIYNSL